MPAAAAAAAADTNKTRSPQKVLIIGGGMGGTSSVAGLRKVNKSVEIILVEPKEYMEVSWAAYRSPFEDWVAKGSVYPLKPFCEKHNVQHLRSLVTSLSKTTATLENGETIDFDVCVVAAGATTAWEGLGRGPHNWSVQDRLDKMKQEGERLLNAGSVLVIGGGLIGTETAGDVMGYAKKAGKPMQVTLVHSKEHLCPEMSDSPAAAAKVKEQLEKTGVRVILGDKAVKEEGSEGTYKLQKSGEVLEVNEVLMTNGLSAVNEFFQAGGLGSSLTEDGWIDTDDNFLVKHTDGRIFSIGDCCTTLPNAGAQILQNIHVIGNNVQTALKSSKSTFKPFSLGPQLYLTTTGPKSGVMYSPRFWTTWLFPFLKRKTMFFFRPKNEIGIKSVA